jgi:hypothetical protein
MAVCKVKNRLIGDFLGFYARSAAKCRADKFFFAGLAVAAFYL